MSKITKVEAAVRALHTRGLYPSQSRINDLLGRNPGTGLSSKECATRKRVAAELGINLRKRGDRFDPVNAPESVTEETAEVLGSEATSETDQDFVEVPASIEASEQAIAGA